MHCLDLEFIALTQVTLPFRVPSSSCTEYCFDVLMLFCSQNMPGKPVRFECCRETCKTPIVLVVKICIQTKRLQECCRRNRSARAAHVLLFYPRHANYQNCFLTTRATLNEIVRLNIRRELLNVLHSRRVSQISIRKL